MNEILNLYRQEAKENLSSLPWLAQLQMNAFSQLEHYGFPKKRDEDWKYTPVEALLKQPFKHSSSCIESYEEHLELNLPIQQQLLIHNGLIYGADTITKSLPEGVLVLPLSVALIQHQELVKSYLSTILKPEHGFHFLNSVMIHHGVFIYIPAETTLKEPILLNHFQNQTNQAVYLRHLIIAEENSNATIIEDYQGKENCSYLTNSITEISVGSGAKLTHCTTQQQSKSAFHLGHLSVQQMEGSTFSSHSLNIGGKMVRSDISLYLHEERAHALMNGIYAPTEGQHIDHHTQVEHLVPNCSSDQNYKGVLNGHSRAVFNGKVLVAKNAQHTNAKQQNKNLLLSANAEVDTKPQLEIYADDVLCSHGATVGQLDEEALFYLATRGIDKIEATHYLIKAFVNENLQLIPNCQLSDFMGNLLTKQLGTS